jgi:hypothetical protein
LVRVHEIEVVGAAWDAESLPAAIQSFRATLLVAAPDFTVPPELEIPQVVVPSDANPAELVAQYLAAQAPETPEETAPVPQSGYTSTSTTAPSTAPPPPHLDLPRPRRTVRLGFWGERGGVGTTTAALTAAQQLAQRGFKVALCDATKRGDTFLWAGYEPQAKPSTTDAGLTFFPNLPPEEDLHAYPAVVIDGGRKRRDRNVAWVRVTAPLSDESIERLVEKQC